MIKDLLKAFTHTEYFAHIEIFNLHKKQFIFAIASLLL